MHAVFTRMMRSPVLLQYIVLGYLLVLAGMAALEWLSSPADKPAWLTQIALLLGLIPSALLYGLVRRHRAREQAAEQAAAVRQRETRALEARYSILFDSVAEGILLVDLAQGTICHANPAVGAMLGYGPEELLGRSWQQLHPPEAREGLQALFEFSGRQNHGTFNAVPFLRKDGRSFPGDVSTAHIQGEGQHWLAAIIQDASPRIQAQQRLDQEVRTRTRALAMNEARSRAIHRAMLDGMVLIDARGVILMANDAVHEMFGYGDEELMGQNVSVLVPEPHRSAHDGYLARYLSERTAHILGRRHVEVMAQRQDGSLFPVELLVNEIVDDEGSSFIGILRDITDRRAAQELLEKALAEARASTQAKGAFLANMSHEIRTPINAILGFSHLCLQQTLPAGARGYVEKVHSAAESLLGIVNDVLDFSKIEANKLELESVPFALDEVLERVSALFSLRMREKGLEFAAGALPGVPYQLRGDPLRLSQVLINLVGNALKFTTRGEIGLTVERVETDKNRVTLRFTVRDTGLGMSEAQCRMLFQPFTQADTSTTRKFGGTGLGLAISRQLVEMMQGEIGVTSTPGEGSRFSFTARFLIQENPTDAGQRLTGKTVLVVDDNAIMRTLLGKMVEGLGARAQGVASGEAAVEYLATDAPCHAVLLDWKLPGMDGIELARWVRAQAPRQTLPLIMISAGERETLLPLMASVGIQVLLSKPADRLALHQALMSTILGEAAPRTEPPEPIHPAPSSPGAWPRLAGRRVLLVDDNEFNREVGAGLLQVLQVQVDTAADGQQAVAAVRDGAYELVLMDIQMPVMDGYDATRAIRAFHPDLPIIALTAHALEQERKRSLAAGMNDMITKPIRPDTLYATLDHWLSAGPGAPDAVAADSPAPGDSEPARQETPAPAPPPPVDVAGLLDREAGLATVGGDAAFLTRMLRMFGDNPNVDLGTVHAALDEGDLARAQRQVHSLKGMAGYIGARPLQEAAASLEASLKSGTVDPDGLAALESILARTRVAIAAALAEDAGAGE